MNKNVYIIYLPGYSGNYINWYIAKSDSTTASTTIDSPLNMSPSDKYGGVGTSHLHHRFPTHLSIKLLTNWLILHKPSDYKCYNVNSGIDTDTLSESIHAIMSFDRDPVIIHITAMDSDTQSLAFLNAYTKWPVFFKILTETHSIGIDLYNDEPNRIRNYVAENSSKMLLSLPFHKYGGASGFAAIREAYGKWYRIRNQYHPHEVNEVQFIEPCSFPKWYFNIDLRSIYDSTFIDKLKGIIAQVNLGTFNWDHVKKYHQTYVSAQKTLIFLNEIKLFRATRLLTEYLTSNPVIEGLLIKELLPNLPKNYNWETKSTQEIVTVNDAETHAESTCIEDEILYLRTHASRSTKE